MLQVWGGRPSLQSWLSKHQTRRGQSYVASPTFLDCETVWLAAGRLWDTPKRDETTERLLAFFWEGIIANRQLPSSLNTSSSVGSKSSWPFTLLCAPQAGLQTRECVGFPAVLRFDIFMRSSSMQSKTRNAQMDNGTTVQ